MSHPKQLSRSTHIICFWCFVSVTLTCFMCRWILVATGLPGSLPAYQLQLKRAEALGYQRGKSETQLMPMAEESQPWNPQPEPSGI